MSQILPPCPQIDCPQRVSRNKAMSRSQCHPATCCISGSVLQLQHPVTLKNFPISQNNLTTLVIPTTSLGYPTCLIVRRGVVPTTSRIPMSRSRFREFVFVSSNAKSITSSCDEGCQPGQRQPRFWRGRIVRGAQSSGCI